MPRGSKPGERRGGRKAGTPNKATAEAKEACALIVDDPIYRRNLLKRARAGKLAPAVESMLWHYSKGKPKEQVEHSTVDGRPLPLSVTFGGRYKPPAAEV